MRVFRRVMLGGGIDIDTLPDTQKLYYKATSKVNPVSGSLGAVVMVNKWDSTTNEGLIVCNKDIKQIGEKAFSSNTNLIKITIPTLVETIGKQAFKDCHNLEYVDIQAACHIDYKAFETTCLSYINIPKGTTFVQRCFDDDWFTGDRKERHVYFGGTIEDWIKIDFYDGLSNPLYQSASDSNSKPSILYINNHIVEDISIPFITRPYSFINCGSLKSVIIEGGDSILKGTFSQCVNLTKITLPNTLTHIIRYSFTDCINLKQVTYNGELEDWLNLTIDIYRGWYADNSPLEYCEEFYIGKNKETLVNITIPDSIVTIKSGVLSFIPTLQSITFHSNVSKLENIAILSNPLIKYCDFSNHTSVPKIDHYNAIYDVPSTFKIIVPDVLYDDWIAATNWSAHAEYIIKKSDWDTLQVTE